MQSSLEWFSFEKLVEEGKTFKLSIVLTKTSFSFKKKKQQQQNWFCFLKNRHFQVSFYIPHGDPRKNLTYLHKKYFLHHVILKNYQFKIVQKVWGTLSVISILILYHLIHLTRTCPKHAVRSSFRIRIGQSSLFLFSTFIALGNYVQFRTFVFSSLMIFLLFFYYFITLFNNLNFNRRGMIIITRNEIKFIPWWWCFKRSIFFLSSFSLPSTFP